MPMADPVSTSTTRVKLTRSTERRVILYLISSEDGHRVPRVVAEPSAAWLGGVENGQYGWTLPWWQALWLLDHLIFLIHHQAKKDFQKCFVLPETQYISRNTVGHGGSSLLQC